jgi:hypothetical protein
MRVGGMEQLAWEFEPKGVVPNMVESNKLFTDLTGSTCRVLETAVPLCI